MYSDDNRIIEKFNQIQIEILEVGWQGVLKRYHPDNNCDSDNAYEIFKLYKEIYLHMQKQLIIEIKKEIEE